MSQEVECFLPSIQYPSFLGVQRKTQAVKNRPSLIQIELWTLATQDDEVIGVSHNVGIVTAFAEASPFPGSVQPMQIEVRKQRRNDSLNEKDTFLWKARSAAQEPFRATHSVLPRSVELGSSVES